MKDPFQPANLSHYRLVSKLGAGGMGDVYLAEDARLGRKVAVKMLPAELIQNPESVRRFIQEAKAASALNHPNIITVYDIGESNSERYLVMELVSGSTLRSMAATRHTLPAILPWCSQMAKALAAAHAAGITHRDIKPENIMIRDDGYVKVLDFGLARLALGQLSEQDETTAQQTMPGQLLGTVKYMSPEQARGEAVGPPSDIFSLGLVFYELASGQYPFRAESAIGFLHAITTQEPPKIETIPPAFQQVISAMLSKEASERPTAKEVDEAIRAVERGEAPALRASTTVAADEGFWVAVLPFKHRGPDGSLEALAEGMTEEIITGLSRFSYLRVIARGSTLQYTGNAWDIRAIGKQLSARYVMEGSLRQSGSRIRATVQLVDAVTGSQLWAENYDRPFAADDVFALQDDLVPRIVSTVADQHGVLPHSIASVIRNKSDDQLSPYEAVLSVFSFHERMSPEEHARVRTLLERMVKHAPDASDCWAMLATLYGDEHMFGFPGDPDPLDRAQVAARRAAELAPASALTCQALAQVLFFRKEWQAFRPVARKGISLNRMDGALNAFLGMLLALSGEWDEGRSIAEAAMQLNPHFPGWYWIPTVQSFYHKRDYEASADAAMRINMPGYFWGPVLSAAAFGQLRNTEAAGKALKELLEIRPDFGRTARRELGKWFDDELLDHYLEGLAKAGLKS